MLQKYLRFANKMLKEPVFFSKLSERQVWYSESEYKYIQKYDKGNLVSDKGNLVSGSKSTYFELSYSVYYLLYKVYIAIFIAHPLSVQIISNRLGWSTTIKRMRYKIITLPNLTVYLRLAQDLQNVDE